MKLSRICSSILIMLMLVTLYACGTQASLPHINPPHPPINLPAHINPPSTVHWHLIFDDQFDKQSLDTSLWTPGWFGIGITQPVNHAEKACYDSTHVTESNGSLQLLLTHDASNCKGNIHPYTGGIVSTNPGDGVDGHTGFQFTYGYIEVRAYLPPHAGVIANWPAILTTGQNWPYDGENDIMEGLGGQACYHYHVTAGGYGGCITGNYTGWHTFASDWEPGTITYYYDGVEVGKLTENIASSPHYILILNTISSDTTVSVPASVMVDYVRVWQK